jgi:hypothetical protein
MFNDRHYVPVLRWKTAELGALKDLRAAERASLTPLFEPIPKTFHASARNPSGDIRLATAEILQKLDACWGRAHFFIDFLHLPEGRVPDAASALRMFSRLASRYGLAMIPVTGLNRPTSYDSEVSETAAHLRSGVCLRLSRHDVSGTDFLTKLQRQLHSLNLRPPDVDLVIDLVVSTDELRLVTLCRTIPELRHWRSFTILSGSFPRDLSGITVGQHLLPRLEWQRWRDQIQTPPAPARKPAFGDYTIQHSIYVAPPTFANFSASIRYCAEDYWVVMRGEGVLNEGGAGYDQWPANAQLLCDRPEFCGPSFSSGDSYIVERAAHPERTGNATTWLRAGINHHLTYVVHQLASLGGLSAVAAL